MYKAIINANVVTENGILYDGAILLNGNRIAAVCKNKNDLPSDVNTIDAKGAYVGPGFVDIHVHGSRTTPTYDRNAGAVDHFVKHGTTTLLATPYYSQNLSQIVPAIKDARAAMQKSSVIKGLYLEGPYINTKYGANSTKNPWRHGIVKEEYEAIVDACGTDVKVWTIAPELSGIRDFLTYARQVNPSVAFAVGHSEATPEQIADLGVYRPKLLTHAMDATGRLPTPTGTRGYGPDEYCFAQPDVFAELISDSCGIHVGPSLQQMLLRVKGVDKVVLITDSCMEDSPSPACYAHITDLNFDDRGNLNGSMLTLDVACRNVMSHTRCGITEAFIMASLNPAKVIGLDGEIGSVAEGKIADLVFVDDRFHVQNVMTEGELYE